MELIDSTAYTWYALALGTTGIAALCEGLGHKSKRVLQVSGFFIVTCPFFMAAQLYHAIY